MYHRTFVEVLLFLYYKGNDKPANDPSSYRGISIVSKLFEKLLFIYVNKSISSFLHPLQGGFRHGLSSLHTSYILQEAISECRGRNKKAYICLLDAQKAFDTVDHGCLFTKLLQTGISRDIFLTLLFWYSNLSSCVRWNASLSDLSNKVCIRVLYSPHYFIPYILMTCFTSWLVLFLTTHFVGPLLMLTIWADFPTVLQCMIDTAASYAMNWHYCFNVSKSVVLVVGESTTARAAAPSSCQWFLSGSPFSEVDMTKHLGIVLSVNSPHAHRALLSLLPFAVVTTV